MSVVHSGVSARPFRVLRDGTTLVPLTQGAFAVIDTCDLRKVITHRWRLMKIRRRRGDGFHLYAYTQTLRGGRKSILYLHRLLMRPPDGMKVDHKDGDGLNCTRSNMRIATSSQNNCNRGSKPGSSSRFKGVSWDKEREKWCSYIEWCGRSKNLGRYAKEEDAARAYDRAAVSHFGEFAHLNFPEEYR